MTVDRERVTRAHHAVRRVCFLGGGIVGGIAGGCSVLHSRRQKQGCAARCMQCRRTLWCTALSLALVIPLRQCVHSAAVGLFPRLSALSSKLLTPDFTRYVFAASISAPRPVLV